MVKENPGIENERNEVIENNLSRNEVLEQYGPLPTDVVDRIIGLQEENYKQKLKIEVLTKTLESLQS